MASVKQSTVENQQNEMIILSTQAPHTWKSPVNHGTIDIQRPTVDRTASDVHGVGPVISIEPKLCQNNIVISEGKNAAFISSQESLVFFECHRCEFRTTKEYQIKLHNISHCEPTQKEFHCPDCNFTTIHKGNLRTHLKKHADVNELEESDIYQCDKCDYKTLYKQGLSMHICKHDGMKPFRCEFCNFSTIYKPSLDQHVDSKHNRLRPYSCSHCSYTCARKQDLVTHETRHQPQKPYSCQLCSFKTYYKQSLKSHVDRHNLCFPKMHFCTMPDCNYRTKNLQTLESHMLNHPSEKPFKCNRCTYSTGFRYQLLLHEAKHSPGVKKCYRCNLCPFTTALRYSLKRHLDRHEPDRKSPEKLFKCDSCGYQTAYKNSLKRHLAKHSDVKPYRCGHCDYSAINMSQMRVHIAKHTGIKPFACSDCDYKTANKQHLLLHAAKHSNTQMRCNLCLFKTAWKARMRAHLRTHETGQALDDTGSGTVASQSEMAMETSNQGFLGMDQLQVVDSVPTVTMATEKELKQISDVIATHNLLAVRPKADQEAECDETSDACDVAVLSLSSIPVVITPSGEEIISTSIPLSIGTIQFDGLSQPISISTEDTSP